MMSAPTPAPLPSESSALHLQLLSPACACWDTQLLCLLGARRDYQNISAFEKIRGVCQSEVRERKIGTEIKHDIFYFLLTLVPLGTDLFHNHWDILDWQTPWTWKSARQCWCACSHPGAKSSFWAFCSFYWTVLQSIGEGLWSTDEVKNLGCMCLQATSRPVLGFGSYTFLKNSLSHPAPSEWEKADLEHEHQGKECCNKWA